LNQLSDVSFQFTVYCSLKILPSPQEKPHGYRNLGGKVSTTGFF